MHDTTLLELRLKAQRAALLLLLLAMALSLALLWAQRNASAAEDRAHLTTMPPDRAADQTIELQQGTMTVYKPDPSVPDIRVTEQCDDQGSCTFSSPAGLVSGTITAAPAAAESSASSTSTYDGSSTELPDRPADQVIELQHATARVYKADPNAPDIELTEQCDDQGRCTYSTPDGRFHSTLEQAPAGTAQADGARPLFSFSDSEQHDETADTIIVLEPTS